MVDPHVTDSKKTAPVPASFCSNGNSKHANEDNDEPSAPRSHVLVLAYRSIGIVFCQLSVNPLYVYRNTLSNNLINYKSEDTIFGVFSLIFWTFTLISLIKYAGFMLSVDDNGEGGLFALYSLLCRHAKFCLLPNRQPADEEISTYGTRVSPNQIFVSSSASRKVAERDKKIRTALLLLVLFGASMVIAYGVLTPSISVLSSLEGLEVGATFHHGLVVLLACVLLIGLFIFPYWGTHKVAFMFAPIVMLWFLTIASVGIYNIIHWNPTVYRALSPYFMYDFFVTTGKDGWLSLGGILLSITGSEVIFAYLGRFTASSIRVSFCAVVYPCLVLQYMGQAAYFSVNFTDSSMSFYNSIPEPVFWPVFVLATLAAVVASQAVIAATFSIVRQSHALGCFPRIKIVHKSKWIDRQIFIPEINWFLMMLSLSVTLGVGESIHIGNAYGMACILMMFVTTFLMFLIIHLVRQKGFVISLLYLASFGTIELIFLSSSSVRFVKGGWIPLVLAAVIVFIMYVWQYCTWKKYLYDAHNKLSMKWVLNLDSDLKMIRVPGIGLIYTELASGVPAVFSNFLSNLPTFYTVIVFVSVKTVPVPSVPEKERYLIGRVGPKSYRMYRCLVRYGYKDIHENQNDYDFENTLVTSLAEFIQLEAECCGTVEGSVDGRFAVVRTSENFGKRFVFSDFDDSEKRIDPSSSKTVASSLSPALLKLKSTYEEEAALLLHKRQIHYTFLGDALNDSLVKDEILDLLDSKRAGVAYVIGHSRIKAKWNASFLKQFVVNIVFSFLRKNCRSPSVFLKIPQSSLIEVGMNYYL